MVNFNEIYDKVFAHKGELEKLLREYKAARKKMVICFLIIFLSIIFFTIFFRIILINGGYADKDFLYYINLIIITVIIIGCIIFLNMYFQPQGKQFIEYRNKYKELVINDIIKIVDDNLMYLPNQGLSLDEYHRGFNDSGTTIKSEDIIKGNILNNISIVMSQIMVTHVERDTDSKGHTTTTTVTDYFGLMGYASLPNSVKSNFMITSNSKFNQFSKSRIEMESYEFEKLYDVMAADRVYAMKLLKPQIIEEFTNLKESNCKGFEIKFEGNMAYFRYKAGNIFEPPTRGNILNPDKVKEFIMTIYNPIHILLLMNETISDKYGIVTNANNNENKTDDEEYK